MDVKWHIIEFVVCIHLIIKEVKQLFINVWNTCISPVKYLFVRMFIELLIFLWLTFGNSLYSISLDPYYLYSCMTFCMCFEWIHSHLLSQRWFLFYMLKLGTPPKILSQICIFPLRSIHPVLEDLEHSASMPPFRHPQHFQVRLTHAVI